MTVGELRSLLDGTFDGLPIPDDTPVKLTENLADFHYRLTDVRHRISWTIDNEDVIRTVHPDGHASVRYTAPRRVYSFNIEAVPA
jgi:hypothetical protein